MAVHKKTGNRENARKELKKFNGALTRLLTDQGIVNDTNKAKNAINFVRDFLWKRDHCTASCVIENFGKNNEYQMLRYSEPLTFKEAPNLTKHGKPVDVWSGNQPWRIKLEEKVGGDSDHLWFTNFMHDNLDEMKNLSSTSMSRYTPNLANAFDCSDIVIQNNEVQSISHHLKNAITEPVDVGATDSRQEVTDWNHFQMISNERIESEVNAFLESWGTLYPKGEIPLTMLHQTLVGDEASFTPDQQKAKKSRINGSVIESKLEANAALRETIAKTVILRNSTTGEIERLSIQLFEQKYGKYPAGIPNDCREVKIKLLETNHCINMWSELFGMSFVRVRNNDLNDARELINVARAKFFEEAKPKLLDDQETDLNRAYKTILEFLDSADHSLFTDFKFRGEAVKEAVEQVTKALRHEPSPQFSHVGNKAARQNLALSLQAAVELKCTVHETWLGALRRNISNFSCDYIRPFPLIGWIPDFLIRGTMTLIAFLLRPFYLLFNPVQVIKHIADRREVYMAAYEGLLAESLGALQGGCLSSLDRATEMEEQKVAMRKQFIVEGQIIGFNDSSSEKQTFYTNYGSTKTKHHNNEIGSGIETTCDDETASAYNPIAAIFPLNLMSRRVESKEEQEMSKGHMRKGDYDFSVKPKHYLRAPAVGVSEVEHRASEQVVNQPRLQRIPMQPQTTIVAHSQSQDQHQQANVIKT